MRDKLGDTKHHGRSRGAGAADNRISPYVRKQSYNSIPTSVGTPVVWVVPDDYSMSGEAGVLMSSFTDRMGVGWAAANFDGTSSTFVKCPAVLNGRNAFGLFPDTFINASLMQSDAVLTGVDVTVICVFRDMCSNGTFPSVNPRHFEKGNNDEWNLASNNRSLFWQYKAGTSSTQTYTMSNTYGGLYIMAGRGSAGTVTMHVNGTSVGSATPSSALSNATTRIYWGGSVSGKNTLDNCCLYGDLIVYNSYLSDANRNAVEKDLGRRYGIAVS